MVRQAVDSPIEMFFEVLLGAEVALEELRGVPPLEGDHEIQAALSVIELFSRRRDEQVEALDAVATADLPYHLDLVFNDRNLCLTQLQNPALQSSSLPEAEGHRKSFLSMAV